MTTGPVPAIEKPAIDYDQRFIDQTAELLRTNPEARMFDLMRRGQPAPLALKARLGLKALFVDPWHHFIRQCPGGIGMLIREHYYRHRLKSLGCNCLFGECSIIDGPHNISIGDHVWIDRHVTLDATIGSIHIGRRAHIAPGVVISGLCEVFIEDYVGLSRGVMIFSHSEAPRAGKRMSGPMIPEEFKAMVSKPVLIEKDAFLGTNVIVLPGVTIGQGAVVAANSLVTRSVPPWTIAMGTPAQPVSKRAPVTVPDI